jgi:hypothetical protein
MRARGFALRDAFPDMLRGIMIKEEAEDMPRERQDYSDVGITIDMKAEQVIDNTMLSLLRDKMADADSKEIDVCHFLKVDSLEGITVVQYQQVCKMLDRKIKRSNKVDDLEINKLFGDDAIAGDVE